MPLKKLSESKAVGSCCIPGIKLYDHAEYGFHLEPLSSLLQRTGKRVHENAISGFTFNPIAENSDAVARLLEPQVSEWSSIYCNIHKRSAQLLVDKY